MKPPFYKLENIKGFKISLVCGKGDMLASPDDYKAVRDMLVKNGNEVEFKEYNLGHVGLVIPKDKTSTHDIL